MKRGRLVVHAHFYQPSRVDPFTGRVPEDASAAPFRDWNARITEECYRPIAERGTAAHISWNMGPTLTGYLATAAPEVLAGFAAADREGGGTGIAQPFHHSILPLAAVARPADGDPVGRPRLRGALRTPARRRCGCPRRQWTSPRWPRWRRPGRGDDPRAVAGGRREPRHPRAVPGRRRRRPPRHGRALRRRPLGRGVVRAGRDGRRGPVRARADPCPAWERRGRPALPPATSTTARTSIRWSSSRATASSTATTSRSATCSWSGSSPPRIRRRDRGFDVVDLADRRRRARRPPAPGDPDPGANVVELPPRGASLVRRVPGRAGRPLEGATAIGAGPARRGHRRGQRAPRPGAAGPRGRRGRRATHTWTWSSGPRRATRSRPAAWARAPPPTDRRRLLDAARGPALAPRDVRLGRLVLGRPVAAGDPAGAAVGGARGTDRRPPRRNGPGDSPRRRPRDAPLARPGHRRGRDLPACAQRDRPATPRGLTGACEDHRHGESTRRVREHRRPLAAGSARGRPRARHRARLRRADLAPRSTGSSPTRSSRAACSRGRGLPPVRELGAALRVNPNTVRAVYRRLADAGLRRRPARCGHARRRSAAGPAGLGRAGRDRRRDAAAGRAAGLHARRGRPGHVHRRDRAQASRAAGAGPVRRVHERRRDVRRRAHRRGVPRPDRGDRRAARRAARPARALPLRPRRHHDVPRRRGAGLRRRSPCR